jgi:hypothetical protein
MITTLLVNTLSLKQIIFHIGIAGGHGRVQGAANFTFQVKKKTDIPCSTDIVY